MIEKGVTPFLDQITGKDPVTLKIRYAATQEKPSSQIRTVNLYVRAPMPTNLTIDDNTYIVSGVDSNMQYLAPTETYWRSVSGRTVDVSSYAKSDSSVTILFLSRSTLST